MAENEVVKYHNELNTVVMKRWTAEELNLFFTVIAKARDNDTREINLSSDDLRRIMQYKSTSKARWLKTIDEAVNKMDELRYYENSEKHLLKMSLFTRFYYNKEADTLDIKLSEDYKYILNNITKNFTIFELSEFIELKSTYSKSMFRLLKQWRTVGTKTFSKEDLCLFMDVPESIQDSKNFNARVMNPIKKELTPLFKGLKVEPIRAKTQGRPVTHYKFTWQAEKVGQWIEGKYDKPKFNGRPAKQEIIPEWMQNRPANEPAKQSNPSPETTDKEAEIRARLASLIDGYEQTP